MLNVWTERCLKEMGGEFVPNNPSIIIRIEPADRVVFGSCLLASRLAFSCPPAADAVRLDEGALPGSAFRARGLRQAPGKAQPKREHLWDSAKFMFLVWNPVSALPWVITTKTRSKILMIIIHAHAGLPGKFRRPLRTLYISSCPKVVGKAVVVVRQNSKL